MEKKTQKKLLWPLVIAALMFGAMIALGRKIHFAGNVHLSYTMNTFDDFVWTDLVVFALAAVGTFALLLVLDALYDRIARPADNKAFNKKLFIICFVVLCLCWLPFFLKDFPGTVVGDSFHSVNQGLGVKRIGNHFLVFYTLFVAIFLRIGAAFGSIMLGVFLYSLTQYLVMAAVYARFLTWLDSKGVKRWYLVLTLAFFAIPQSFAMYAVIMWKDPLFTAFLLFLTMMLFDAVQSRGALFQDKKFVVKWVLLLLGTIFFRNNGLYIVIGIFVLLLFAYRKQAKRVLIATLCVIIAARIIVGPVYDALRIEKDSVVESVGIPLQQMAYVAVYGGEMNETEYASVTKLMPIEEYKRVYTPCIVDTIKWDYDYFDRSYLDTQTGEVLKNWATIGVKNFPAYVKAYCLETFGYWKIGARNSNGDMMEGIIENVYGYDLYTINLLQKLPGGAVLERMQAALQFHFSAGTLFALWVLCLALLLRRRAYKLALVLAPGAFLWITLMLAAPVAFSMRYVYLLLVAFPLIPLLPMWTKDEQS